MSSRWAELTPRCPADAGSAPHEVASLMTERVGPAPDVG